MTFPILHLDLDDIGRELWARALKENRLPNLSVLLSRFARHYPKFWARDMCSPFRAGPMTGSDPHRPNNLVGNIIRSDHDFELPVTPGKMLPMGMPGWKTHRGKWHLGNEVDHPIRCGFDEWSGTTGNLKKGGYTNWTLKGVDALGNDIYEQMDQHATEWLFDAVMADLVSGVEFIHASFHAVHEPLHAPPGYPPRDNDDDTRLDMLEHMEGFLAMLIVTALRKGYLIFLMTDNGTPESGKNTLKEAGINTPFYALGTQVQQGVSQELIQCTDLYNTYQVLRGLPMDSTAHDSVDLSWDVVLSPVPSQLYVERVFATCCDFKQNGQVPKVEDMRRAVKDRYGWKLIAYGDGTEELYWLTHDPDEQDNRILDNSSVADYLRPHLPTP